MSKFKRLARSFIYWDIALALLIACTWPGFVGGLSEDSMKTLDAVAVIHRLPPSLVAVGVSFVAGYGLRRRMSGADV